MSWNALLPTPASSDLLASVAVCKMSRASAVILNVGESDGCGGAQRFGAEEGHRFLVACCSEAREKNHVMRRRTVRHEQLSEDSAVERSVAQTSCIKVIQHANSLHSRPFLY